MRIELIRPVAVDARPLVVHIVHRFATGGLENGVANLINHMPPAAYRHLVLALTEVTDFRHRIARDDVGFVALNKLPGHGFKLLRPVLSLLREWRPAVVHTRNLGPLELQPAAAWAGVAARIHGEHGREQNDIDGNNRRLQWVRRGYSPFVHRYVALSRDLDRYLVGRVGIAPQRISQIYNGADMTRFRPQSASALPAGYPFDPAQHWVIGTVGRMHGVKHQPLLARAFVRALQRAPALRERARLVMVGDGPLRSECAAILQAAGCEPLSWLAGERSDVADVMRVMSCFVLPSLAEGISNTILEAMASGLPVIATAVGGNVEIVQDGSTGLIVPADDVEAMADAILRLFRDPAEAKSMGDAGRSAVEQHFSLQAMVAAYQRVYDRQLAAAKPKL